MLVASSNAAREFPLWPPLLASRGRGSRSGRHAHHALHFLIALEGELRARGAEAWQASAGVLTAPDQPHEIDATGTEVLIVFLDPESAAGAALHGVHAERGLRLLTATERDQLASISPQALMREDGVAWAERALRVLGAPAQPKTTVHPRVRRALRHLQNQPPEGDQSLPALARVAGLSEGRFMHAFTESVGIPLRPYLAWLKLQRAAAAIVSGSSLAEAAHGAGFADAAHMTRSFKRMFGVKPSELRPA
jgi:AraC-like DNA-binding protein